MREKLIELLCKAHGMATDASLFEDASYAQQLEAEADHLIANGVTIPVRCEKCRFFYRHTQIDTNRGDCWKYGISCLIVKKLDDFCSYGERRTDEVT